MTAPAMQESREAGRELDALIAEKVIGGTWIPNKGCPGHEWLEIGGVTVLERGYPHKSSRRIWDACPEFSASMGDAWLVVEKMSATWVVGIDGPDPVTRRSWVCTLLAADLSDEFSCEAETPALAICRAALASVEAP